jgi:NAD(P)-dependent dehydrogenase (short-subunit alcohol dehydrogenase family)
MLIDLQGRTALVTGGSKGLGRAMARRFAQSGADVVILARDARALDEAAAEISAETGRRVRGYSCDVSQQAAIDATFEALRKDFPSIDILVNNAGSSSRSPIDKLTSSMLETDMALKIHSALHLSQHVLPGMKERRWGRIVNVVNIGAKAPEGGSAPTSMTRAAGITMTKVMANELAPHNILVNALCVGKIRSEQWVRNHQRDAPQLSFQQYVEKLGAKVPLGRLGEAEEFAQIACFLVSDMASYITGTAINVDGGTSPVV